MNNYTSTDVQGVIKIKHLVESLHEGVMTPGKIVSQDWGKELATAEGFCGVYNKRGCVDKTKEAMEAKAKNASCLLLAKYDKHMNLLIWKNEFLNHI